MSRYDMIPVAEAMAIIKAVVRPLPAELVPTQNADGRILAEDVYSSEDVPPFRASTVDGFAVIASDTETTRDVAQEITAGEAGRPALAPGTAARIMTGAPVPAGADAVVMIEDTQPEG